MNSNDNSNDKEGSVSSKEWRETILESSFSEEVKCFWGGMHQTQQNLCLFEAAMAVAEGEEKEMLVFARDGNVGGSSFDLGEIIRDIHKEHMNEELSQQGQHMLHVMLLGSTVDTFINKVLDDTALISRFTSVVVVSVMKAMKQKETNLEYSKPLPGQEMDDRDTLLTLLPDLSKKERDVVRGMSSQQADLLMKRLFLFMVPRSATEPEKSLVARVFAGFVTEKEILLEIANDETLVLFKGVKLPDHLMTTTDKKLQEQDREVRKEKRECTACGICKSVKELKACANCHSVWYCSKACQVSDWDACHKNLCKTMRSEWVVKTNPLKNFQRFDRGAIHIPSFCFAVPPSLTGYPRDVWVLIPQWDMQDKKQCDEIKCGMKRQQHAVVQNLKRFFKLERSGGVTGEETVGNMCIDAFALYLSGYKGVNGDGIRQVMRQERLRSNAFQTYQHFTAVPRGWSIPAHDRATIPFRDLELLEAGIELVRQNAGEREALE